MNIFFTLFSNLIPLYALIFIGFIAGRYFDVERRTLANLAIYVCVPVVTFGFIAQLEFEAAYIALPFVVYGLHAFIGLTFYALGRRVFRDNRANLLSMCAAMGNVGYFGLPLALLLFEQKWVAVYMFMILGGGFYEATIGYYIAVRGRFDVRDSLMKLAKFPTLYAFAAGAAYNASGLELPETFLTYWTYFKGAFVVVGMMIIGSALSKVRRLTWNPKFVALAFSGKFIVWPLAVLLLVLLDQHTLRLFGEDIYHLALIAALVPHAANITAFAAQLDLNPEKAASTVLMGTVFALFYIPAVLVLLGFA